MINLVEIYSSELVGRTYRSESLTNRITVEEVVCDETNWIYIPVPVLSTVKEMLQMAITQGRGDEDMCSVIKTYEEWSGIEVKK